MSSKDEDKILVLKEISKAFGATQALNKVSFEVKKGSIHSIVGENGAGKSTLMKILMGIHTPDFGEIYLGGKKIFISNPIQAKEAGINIVFQEIELCPNLSIMENIFLGRELVRRGRLLFSEMRSRTEELLNEVNLSVSPEALVSELSVAEKQLVQIARAILFEPKILIFDEPSSALTRDGVQALFRIIQNLHKRGVTILYISHKLDEIFEISDTVTVLRDGRHINTLPVSVVNEDSLVQMMVGRELDLSQRRERKRPGQVLLKVDGLKGDGFDGVSFSVGAGEIVGIAGLVGSGRTEVVETIFGVRRAEAGRVWFKDEEITNKSIAERVKRGMALVPEDRQLSGLIFTMVLRENISLPGIASGFTELGRVRISPYEERRLVKEAMEKMRIVASDSEASMMSLSGGNQQKVVIGKWLSLKPEVLIMDDPTRGIDVGAKAEIHNLIRELANSGKGVLLVSSELPELLALSDRILVMKEGKIRGEISGEYATEEAVMALAVGTREN